jgi:hypothetical protein
MAPTYNSKGEQVSGFIRPAIKGSAPRRVHFQTEIRPDGTRASSWVSVDEAPLIVSGTYGRVGEVVDKMRLGSAAVNRPAERPWRPSYDYELMARNIPESSRAEYMAKCRAWFEAHPTPVVRCNPEPLIYDFELVAAMYTNGSRPTIGKRIKVYRAAGFPEALIQKHIANAALALASSDERQAELDLFFGKWPSASKPTPKVKKGIKAVKKRVC